MNTQENGTFETIEEYPETLENHEIREQQGLRKIRGYTGVPEKYENQEKRHIWKILGIRKLQKVMKRGKKETFEKFGVPRCSRKTWKSIKKHIRKNPEYPQNSEKYDIRQKWDMRRIQARIRSLGRIFVVT